MIILFVFVLLFAIAVGVVTHKSRMAGTGYVSSSQLVRWWRQQPPVRDHRPAATRRDFRAVSIKCGTDCCQAAKKLEGKRGFPSQIPRLPLSQCKAETCSCTYVQHRDRRAGDDRRELMAGLSASLQNSNDRRARYDRRGDENADGLDAFNFSDR